MAAHTHSFPDWPFEDSTSGSAFLCEHVHTGGLPVLTVCHDHNGDWQFLCGGNHSGSRPVLVCLGCAVERHHAPLELAGLPRGWAADRESVSAPWVREQLPPDDEAEHDA